MRAAVLLTVLLAFVLIGCNTVTSVDPVTGATTKTTTLNEAAVKQAVALGEELYKAYKDKKSTTPSTDNPDAQVLASDTAAFDTILKSMPANDTKAQLQKLAESFKQIIKDGKVTKANVTQLLDSLDPLVDKMKDSTAKTDLKNLLAAIRKQMG